MFQIKFLWLFFCFFLGIFYFSFDFFYSQSSFPHLFLAELDVSKKTEEQLSDLLEKKINSFLEKEIYLEFEEEGLLKTSFKNLGIKIDQEKTKEKILDYGKKEGFLENFKKRLKIFFFKEKISPVSRIDREELRKFLNLYFSLVEKKAVNAQIEITQGEVKILLEKEGKVIDLELLAEEIEKSLKSLEKSTPGIKLISKIDQPEIKAEDLQRLKEETNEILAKSLVLKWQDKAWIIKREKIGQWIAFEEKTSFKISRPKILIKKINQEAIRKYLEELAKEINSEKKEAKFQMKDNRVVVFERSKEGKELEIEKNLSEIFSRLEGKEKEIEIDLKVKTVYPEISTEEVNNLGIKELIGRGVSDFKGSPSNRIHNIKNGTKKLNGLLIKPGEIFSLNEALGKIGPEEGYLPGLVIKKGKTVFEYGGGLCQIATTMFRAAIYSGFPIIERKPHAFRVPYYEPAGMDATIYQPYSDLRFENNTPAYLLIQGYIEGTKHFFEFYGTSDQRKVEVSQPRIFNITNPPPTLYIKTKALPQGVEKWQERPYKGADTEFIQEISYPDGRIERKIFKSHYQAWQGIVLVGI